MQPPPTPDPDVLLLFPPGAHNVAHPELGIPQIKGHLQSLGHRVRQQDLNAELIYDHLTRPEVLEGVHARLAMSGDAGHGTDVERWFAALDRMASAHGRSATLGGTAIRPFLTERRAVRGRPFAHWQKRKAPAPAGVTPFTVRCLSDGLFWASFVEALHYLLFSPPSTRIDDVLRFAERLPPILDDFLRAQLGEWTAHRPPSVVAMALWCTSQVPIGIGLARMIREAWPDVTIAAGGAWCSAADSLLPTFPELFDTFDAVVIGQGDDAMAEICARARDGGGLQGIDNVAVRANGAVHVPAHLRTRAILDSALPDFSGLDLSLYPQGDMLPLRLQEGCVWRKCSFCYHVLDRIHAAPRQGDAGRLVDRAIAHANDLARCHGVERVFLLDHAVPLALMEELARRVSEGGSKFQWLAMARFEHRFNRADLKAIAASGCIGLHFGLETADDAVLSGMSKGITLEGVDRDLHALAAAGVPASVFLMHLPGQSREHVERDLAWVHARHALLEGFTIARFELGRGSNGFRNPASLGIAIEPGCERDIDVFAVAYSANATMLSTLELMPLLEAGMAEHARLRGEHLDARTLLSDDDPR